MIVVLLCLVSVFFWPCRSGQFVSEICLGSLKCTGYGSDAAGMEVLGMNSTDVVESVLVERQTDEDPASSPGDEECG